MVQLFGSVMDLLNVRFYFISLTILSINLVSYAQIPETNPTYNFGNHWIFGRNVHIEFTDSGMVQHKISGIDWLEGTSTLSDSIGRLWYYLSNDWRDGNYQYVTTSDGIKLLPKVAVHNSSTQGTILFKHIDGNKLYLFSSAKSGSAGFTIIKPDDSVSGEILIPVSGGEKQQAVNHRNGRDIWYANHANLGDSIYFFLIKKEGLINCPVVAHTGNPYLDNAATQGQMKFSPDGSMLAEGTFIYPFSVGVYNFNNEYPKLDKVYLYSKGLNNDYTRRWSTGVEFSTKNRFLYVGSGRANDVSPPVLYQIDLSSKDQRTIDSSWFILDSLTDYGTMRLQLARNGKIYITLPLQKFLAVINSPNEETTNCGYVREGLELDSGTYGQYGLPTFNQSYFHTPQIDFKYEEDCGSNRYQFWGLDTFGASAYQWVIHPKNAPQDVSERQGKNITFDFDTDQEQTYIVRCIATAAHKTDTVAKEITVRPIIHENFLGKDTFYCQGDTFSWTLRTPKDMHCIHWNGEEPEAKFDISGLNIIRGYQHFHTDTLHIDTAGIYTVRITNKTFCQAWDTFRVIEAPLPTKPLISYETGALASTVIAKTYRWFLNGSFLLETEERSYKPISKGYYQLQLFSEYNCPSPLSDSFLVDTLVNIEKIEKEELFSIYPNPSDGNITIQAMQNIDYQVEVYDMLGKRILQKPNAKSIFIDQKGSYVVKITTESGVWSRVVMVE
jgi:hypothetical protein